MSPTVSSIDVVRVRGGRQVVDRDALAVEEPVEIRLHGQSFAVIMRTPGADKELAAGFLLAERIVRSFDDIGTIEHCSGRTRPTSPRCRNVVNVTLPGSVAGGPGSVVVGSGASDDQLVVRPLWAKLDSVLQTGAPPLRGGWPVSAATLRACPIGCAARSRCSTRPAAFTPPDSSPDGALVTTAEDVGRHNAVDKVIGRHAAARQLPALRHAARVSGRTSFEIVQKAALAGIPVLAAVSAPSSLAVDLAREAGITLIGFVRGGGYTIYAHSARVRRVIFGLAEQKPHHYLEMARIAWENRDQLPLAWRILRDGVCDGCALGTSGLSDWTMPGTHLCMVRLELMRLNTAPALDPAILTDVGSLASMSHRLSARSDACRNRCCGGAASRGFSRPAGTKRWIASRTSFAAPIPSAWRST